MAARYEIDYEDPATLSRMWLCRLATLHLLTATGAEGLGGWAAAHSEMREFWARLPEGHREACRAAARAMVEFGAELDRLDEAGYDPEGDDCEMPF